MPRPRDDYPHMNAGRIPKREMLAEAQNWRCAYCGTPCEYGGPKNFKSYLAMTVDEVTPRSQGGLPFWGNQVMACKLCNEGRSDMAAPRYFAIVQAWGRDIAAVVGRLHFASTRSAFGITAKCSFASPPEIVPPAKRVKTG